MYWYELLFLWMQCYVILTVLNVCTSIGWIIFSHSYLHVTHDKISVCLAIWLIWWTNIFFIKMINTPGHVLSPGWPQSKRSGLTLIEVSQHAYSSYQASSLPFIFYHVILATWCNWLDFYWCWIKFCLSLSLSLSLSLCHNLSLIAYTFRENREFVFIIIVQFMMSANIQIRFGLQIILICLCSTPSHYHHCANLSEGTELIKCLSDIFCRVCE